MRLSVFCNLCLFFIFVLLTVDSALVSEVQRIGNETSSKNESFDFGGNPRIVGGSEASPGMFPWQCLYRATTGGLCGCSVISPRWVLTAAHCTIETPASRMRISMGITNRRRDIGQNFFVDLKIEHEDYNPSTLENDIALLFLDRPATFNSLVRNISIPPQGSDVTVGKSCVISGWGTTVDDPSSPTPSILQHANVPIMSNLRCQRYLREIRVVDVFMCAGFEEGGVDTCQGDSGGPLACFNEEQGKYYLQGVTSFGFNCARARSPGVYTRVSEFSDWIRENSGIGSGSTYSILVIKQTVYIANVLFCIVNFVL